LWCVLKPKVWKLEVKDYMLIEHINNLAAVDTVARQPVGQPRQNPICFAVFYAL
jgi:hypothetical protein